MTQISRKLKNQAIKFWHYCQSFREPHKSIWIMEYDLKFRPKNQPGRVKILGWDLEFIDGNSLYWMVKVNVLERYNDFYTVKPSPRILDCGANIGVSVLRFKQLYPRAKITAFEPDPQLCAVLRRNLGRNGAGDVEVIEAAVWKMEATLGFAPFAGEDSQSGYILDSAEQNVDPANPIQLVRAVSLSDYLADPMDLLKLDIEGAEFEVLESCKKVIKNANQIMLEVHHKVDRVDLLIGVIEPLRDAGFQLVLNTKYGTIRSSKPFKRISTDTFDQAMLIWAWQPDD